MILKTEIGEFCLHFRHYDDPAMKLRKITQASIHEAPCKNEFRPCLTPSESGFAYCAKSDVFSKEKGRKLALSRALYRYNRLERAFIWKAYFERS